MALGDNNWAGFKQLLNIQPQFFKQAFGNCTSFKEVNTVFEQQLGKKIMLLFALQKDWFAFLNNAQNIDERQSKLNNGSVEIDFQTAFAKTVNVIGATCIHIASAKYAKINFQFDYVIMDESSKASAAECLVPINMGKNIVLIGDHKQLPPVLTREEAVKTKVKEALEDNGMDIDKEFGESLFEQLILQFEQNPALQANIKMLDIQYRMPKQIGSLISKHFYDNKLQNPSMEVIPKYDEGKHHGLSFKKDTSIVFISTSNAENPYDNDNKYKRQNDCNVKKIEETLEILNKLYVNNLKQEKPFTIGIIAGYRGQVELLKEKIDLSKYENFVKPLEDNKKEFLIRINTVDQFQGAEEDIIMYDVVKSSKGKSNIGFLDDYRRINVAFSRVKRLLLVVGDSEYLLKRATLNPNSKFEEFKLQEIAQDLENQALIYHSLTEILL